MFSMLGKIFSSSQPRPVKENHTSDSNEESLANINEDEENSEHMEDSESRDSDGGEDMILDGDARGEAAHESGAVNVQTSEDGQEIGQSPPISDKKSRSRKRKRKNLRGAQSEVNDPGVSTTMEEDDDSKTALRKSDLQEEPSASPSKKARKSRKVREGSRRLTRASSQASEAEIAPIVPTDDTGEEDMVVLLKKQHLQKPKPEVSNPRRSRRIASTEPEVPTIVTRSRQTSVELAILPPKTKTTKAKAQPAKYKSRRDIYDISEDEDNAVAASLESMAPPAAKQRLSNSQHASPSKKRVLAAVPVIEQVEEVTLPIALSQKALGKRKASDSELNLSSKKRKRKSNKAPTGTPQLSAFGFLSDDSARAKSDEPELRSMPHPTPQDLASTAQRLYAEAESDPENLPFPSSKMTDFISSQPRQPTQWTPINSPDQVRATLPSRPLSSLSQPQVLIASRALSRSPSSSPRLDIEPPLPVSSGKRKRRIPTGEPESIKSTKLINPRGRKTVSKMPNLEKSTPNPRAPSTAWSTPGRSRVMDGNFDIIVQAVDSWMEENNLTQYEVNDLVQKTVDGQSRAFWNHMAEQVPQIPRKKLQQTCRRNFHNYEARGSWTEEQDDELRRHHELNPGKWKIIGELMNRFAEDCRDRWRNYAVCGDKQRKDAWDKDEEENLRLAVTECIAMVREDRKAGGLSNESLVDEETLIDWKKVSEKMDHTRSRLQCLGKWKALKQRVESDVEDFVADAPVSETTWRLEEAERQAQNMSAKQKLDLLYALRDSGAGSEGKIPWIIIQKDDLHVLGKRMALKVCYRTLKQHIEGHEEMKFQEIIDSLIDAYEEAAPKEPKGFTKTFSSSQQRTLMRRSQTPQSHRRQKRKKIDVNDDISEDNGEGPSTVKKSKLARPRKSINHQKSIDHDSEPKDMETPRASNPKPKIKAKPRINGPGRGKKADMMEEMENDGLSSSAPQPSSSAPQSKKKTLRQSMKPLQEKASQESEEGPHSVAISDDLENLLGTMKTGKARTPIRGGNATRGTQDPSYPANQENIDGQKTTLSGSLAEQSEEEEGSEVDSEGEDQDAINESQSEDGSESQASRAVLDPVEEHKQNAESESEAAEEGSDVVEESETDATSESHVAQDGAELIEESEPESERQTTEESSDVVETSPSEAETESSVAHEVEDARPEADGGKVDNFDQDLGVNQNYTSPGGPDKDEPSASEEDVESFDDEEEPLTNEADQDPTPTHYDRASVDLDADNEDDEHKIIMNGWGQNNGNHEDEDVEEDDEEEDEDEEDEEERGRSPSKRLASPITFVDKKTPRANGFANGYTNGHSKNNHRELSVSSDDSSMSDIPSIPKWKLLQKQAREVSMEL